MSKILKTTSILEQTLLYFEFSSFIYFHHSLNTFRLWIVQIFAIIEEYENEIQQFSIDVASEANLCTMIEYKVNKTQHTVNFGGSSDLVCEAVSYEKPNNCQ